MMRDQKGLAPIIIVAGVVILAAVLITLWMFLKPRTAGPLPSSSPKAFGDCADADYTGCDGVEVFTWQDDGKR